MYEFKWYIFIFFSLQSLALDKQHMDLDASTEHR